MKTLVSTCVVLFYLPSPDGDGWTLAGGGGPGPFKLIRQPANPFNYTCYDSDTAWAYEP
jgi:hypothetical protein